MSKEMKKQFWFNNTELSLLVFSLCYFKDILHKEKGHYTSTNSAGNFTREQIDKLLERVVDDKPV